MSTATQVLAFEATNFGRAGDNNGRWVWSALGYPVYGAWCGGFQLLSLKTNGVARPTTSDIRMIFVPYIIADAKKAGKWIISKNSHPGDLVIFDWSGREVGGDHVGMILENDPSKSYVRTREGNAGAGANGQRNVADHTRSRSLISGCVDMQAAYSKAPAPKPVTPTTVDGKLTVDGYLGAGTLNRWAAVMGTHTGKTDLVKAVQKFLNTKGARDENGDKLAVDGLGLYNNTAADTDKSHTQYALQGYLKMPVKDGRLSHPSDCVKAVQRRLNKAKTGSKEF